MNIGDNLRHQFVRLSYSPEIMSMEFTREEMITIYDYIKSKEEEIERLNNIIKIKTDFIEELLKIIAVARNYELHDKCYTRAKIYEEKLQELKGSEKE